MPDYPERKPNRMFGYDYSMPGWFFITICTKNWKCIFGKIDNGEMKLNEYGCIVQKQWLWIQEHYDCVKMDEFIVMPNHFHGILIIEDETANVGTGIVGTGVGIGTGRDLSLQGKQKIKPLSQLIGAFKTTSSKLIHKSGLPEFSWQRSFYDHIILNEKSLNHIREYIRNNPLKWEIDKNNPINIKEKQYG